MVPCECTVARKGTMVHSLETAELQYFQSWLIYMRLPVTATQGIGKLKNKWWRGGVKSVVFPCQDIRCSCVGDSVWLNAQNLAPYHLQHCST